MASASNRLELYSIVIIRQIDNLGALSSYPQGAFGSQFPEPKAPRAVPWELVGTLGNLFLDNHLS